KVFIVPEKVTYKDILKTNSITCLTAIYDREAIGTFYMPENAFKREDFACFLNILKKVKYAYGNPEVLAMYRLHGSSASAKKSKMIKWQWRVYRRVEHLNFFSSFFYFVSWAFHGLIKHSDLRRQKVDNKK
ncbi:MAG: glycosyltransferase family 2 protein, partial [Firmicutes bacterium]|nr:glycosyltransferase family 2 protein [Bacillota bacterium]